MIVLVPLGIVLTLAGLGGIFWCIRKASWIRKAELEPDAVQAELNRLIFVHMAAIGGAFFGLGLLVVGLILR